MKRFLLLFSVGCLLIVALAILNPSAALADGRAVRDGVIRLHILANSDEASDQAIKLSLRDALLDRIANLTDGCADRDEAEAAVRGSLPDLEDFARSTLRQMDCDQPVEITLSEEYYPTREYENLRLPAGRYLSLRVIIGSGQGHNWWCVLFPPVCTSSASADEELAEVGFTPDQVRLLTDGEDVKYTVRFRIVELFSDLKERISSVFGR